MIDNCLGDVPLDSFATEVVLDLADAVKKHSFFEGQWERESPRSMFWLAGVHCLDDNQIL